MLKIWAEHNLKYWSIETYDFECKLSNTRLTWQKVLRLTAQNDLTLLPEAYFITVCWIEFCGYLFNWRLGWEIHFAWTEPSQQSLTDLSSAMFLKSSRKISWPFSFSLGFDQSVAITFFSLQQIKLFVYWINSVYNLMNSFNVLKLEWIIWDYLLIF